MFGEKYFYAIFIFLLMGCVGGCQSKETTKQAIKEAIKEEDLKVEGGLRPIKMAFGFKQGSIAAFVSGDGDIISTGLLYNLRNFVALLGARAVKGDAGRPYLILENGEYKAAEHHRRRLQDSARAEAAAAGYLATGARRGASGDRDGSRGLAGH